MINYARINKTRALFKFFNMAGCSDLLYKSDLSSEDRFKLLVTDVLVELTREKPPPNPSKSGNYLVDKNAIGVDWKHTSSSWLNRNTKTRIFRRLIRLDNSGDDDPDDAISWAGLQGEGYLLKTTYYNHANEKYSAVRRVITTVESFKNHETGKAIKKTFAGEGGVAICRLLGLEYWGELA